MRGVKGKKALAALPLMVNEAADEACEKASDGRRMPATLHPWTYGMPPCVVYIIDQHGLQHHCYPKKDVKEVLKYWSARRSEDGLAALVRGPSPVAVRCVTPMQGRLASDKVRGFHGKLHKVIQTFLAKGEADLSPKARIGKVFAIFTRREIDRLRKSQVRGTAERERRIDKSKGGPGAAASAQAEARGGRASASGDVEMEDAGQEQETRERRRSGLSPPARGAEARIAAPEVSAGNMGPGSRRRRTVSPPAPA